MEQIEHNVSAYLLKYDCTNDGIIRHVQEKKKDVITNICAENKQHEALTNMEINKYTNILKHRYINTTVQFITINKKKKRKRSVYVYIYVLSQCAMA